MILKDTNNQVIQNFTGTGETEIFKILPNSIQTNALFVINGDSGTIVIQQRVEGDTNFRDIEITSGVYSIDLSTSSGNMLENVAFSNNIEYKVVFTSLVNGTIFINKSTQEV